MKTFYVYKITNLINNKIYIGKSINPSARWARHKCDANKTDNNLKLLFHRAIKKYGSNNFKLEILYEYMNENEALIGEKFFIKQFNSNDLNIGYNLTNGGEGVVGHKRTEEQKRKISIRNSGKGNGQYGKKYTVEEREELSRKISEAKSKRDNSNKEISEATIEKLKIAVKEKSSQKLSDEHKDEIILLYNSGNYLKRNLAEKFDVEEKTIKYIIRYWDEVKNNKNKYLSQKEKDLIIELYVSKIYTKKTNI